MSAMVELLQQATVAGLVPHEHQGEESACAWCGASAAKAVHSPGYFEQRKRWSKSGWCNRCSRRTPNLSAHNAAYHSADRRVPAHDGADNDGTTGEELPQT